MSPVDPSSHSSPSRPLNGDELIRIAVALHTNGGQRTGPSWVIMEKEQPHRVLGVTASRQEGNELLARTASSGGYDIYGPFDPPTYHHANAIRPTEHTETTECAIVPPDSGHSTNIDRPDLVKMQLVIQWKHGGGPVNTTTFTLKNTTDIVFLTRSAREAFAYARYHSLFGAEYANALRIRLGDV